ncbi:MAG TPA: PAS domain S-box protein [Xanthomonadaceae bacterium]|nr:PAS domain S-box protein [Xanthomonadaceae bacterium]
MSQMRAKDAVLRGGRVPSAAEARFSALLAAAPDAIIVADDQGCIVLVNDRALELFGHTREALLGAPLTMLIPERLRDAHESGFRRHLETGETRVIGRTVELPALHRDGGEFPIELSLGRYRCEHGWQFTGIVRDISERRRAEQRIAELNATLQRRAVELQAVNEELESFSYSVSHDLRAPLRAIDGFSRALLEDQAERLDAEGQAWLGRIRAATHRMGVLIDDLLELARVSRQDVTPVPVDLAEEARRIAETLRHGDPERQVELRIPERLDALADPRLLRVALQNLIGNAWKFTGPREHARIELGEEQHDGGPAFYVRDNGVGFDMAYAGKLFGAFQRLHDAGSFPGTGIGLATVQRVIHKHGGRVWAEAAEGAGATFWFTLGPQGAA